MPPAPAPLQLCARVRGTAAPAAACSHHGSAAARATAPAPATGTAASGVSETPRTGRPARLVRSGFHPDELAMQSQLLGSIFLSSLSLPPVVIFSHIFLWSRISNCTHCRVKHNGCYNTQLHGNDPNVSEQYSKCCDPEVSSVLGRIMKFRVTMPIVEKKESIIQLKGTKTESRCQTVRHLLLPPQHSLSPVGLQVLVTPLHRLGRTGLVLRTVWDNHGVRLLARPGAEQRNRSQQTPNGFRP